MKIRRLIVVGSIGLAGVLCGRQPANPGCGTHALRSREELYLHRQAIRRHGERLFQPQAVTRSTNFDSGDIAVIDSGGGVVSRRNIFNLDGKTVVFRPAAPNAARYRLSVEGDTFDDAAAAAGDLLNGLGDDDAREIQIPFAFPFFDAAYRSLFVNSNGNLTFVTGDGVSTEQSLGRLVGGAPRIAPLFCDLDPTAAGGSGGVRVLAARDRMTISWSAVPLYADSGMGPIQNFQVRLYPDGRIEFAYHGTNPDSAVTGIAPGGMKGELSLLPLADGSAQEFSAAIADRFAGAPEVDIALAAQSFYATHEDAYDYLAIFNALGLSAHPGAVAYEVTVRSRGKGFGDQAVDTGAECGSASRLQAILNLGPLQQYPADPNAAVPLRAPTGDTPLSIIGHEAGHLFLAFTSVRDPQNPDLRPMLGRANVHWAFNFNSEASLLEGNRIEAQSAERFLTTKTVEGYSALDQYLMGLRAPEEVPDTFVVTHATVSPARAPQTGIAFSGTRLNVSVNDIIAQEGRRIPDSTVAQRRYRFGFILIADPGVPPTAEQLAQLDAYRAGFEAFYAHAASNRATAEASLKRAVHLSAFPAAGILQGGSGTVTVALESPAAAALTLFVDRAHGLAGAPAAVVIPAGAKRTSFSLQGVKAGVEEISLRTADSRYETAFARVQVLASPASLKLGLASAVVPTAGPVVFQVSDGNDLPYAGVPVSARVSAGGSLLAATVSTDEKGQAAFYWTPGPGQNQITASVQGVPGSTVTAAAIRPVVFGVTNAASYFPGITPRAYATIFGAGLATTAQVLVNGELAQTSYVSDGQINFLVPSDLSGATAAVAIVTPAVTSSEYRVAVNAVSPGIFGVLAAGTGQTTDVHPAAAGDGLEIYATGLNGAAADVSIAGIPATVLYRGSVNGLDQINVRVPQGVPAGPQKLVVTAGGVRSNEVRVLLQ